MGAGQTFEIQDIIHALFLPINTKEAAVYNLSLGYAAFNRSIIRVYHHRKHSSELTGLAGFNAGQVPFAEEFVDG